MLSKIYLNTVGIINMVVIRLRLAICSYAGWCKVKYIENNGLHTQFLN